jgi:hypothetical protein
MSQPQNSNAESTRKRGEIHISPLVRNAMLGALFIASIGIIGTRVYDNIFREPGNKVFLPLVAKSESMGANLSINIEPTIASMVLTDTGKLVIATPESTPTKQPTQTATRKPTERPTRTATAIPATHTPRATETPIPTNASKPPEITNPYEISAEAMDAATTLYNELAQHDTVKNILNGELNPERAKRGLAAYMQFWMKEGNYSDKAKALNNESGENIVKLSMIRRVGNEPSPARIIIEEWFDKPTKEGRFANANYKLYKDGDDRNKSENIIVAAVAEILPNSDYASGNTKDIASAINGQFFGVISDGNGGFKDVNTEQPSTFNPDTLMFE